MPIEITQSDEINKPRKKITEEDGTHEQWMLDAKTQTLATLPNFLRMLTEDYEHDYGTICHAIAAAAIAAAWAVEHSPQGGITGFQAECIAWEIIEGWGSFDKGPKRMLNFANMLYPQYEHDFEKTILPGTWEFLKTEAKKNLDHKSPWVSAEVTAHWQSIVDGKVPFGYRVKEKD